MFFFGMWCWSLHVCTHTYTLACTNACVYEHARMHACIHVQTGVNFQAHANANVFFHVQELRQCKVISKKPVIPTLLSSWFIPRHIHVCVYMMSHTHICHQTKMKYIHIHTGMQSKTHGVEDWLYIHHNYCLQNINRKIGLDHLTPLKEIKARPNLDILTEYQK